jgi:penicillin amidase
MSSSVRLLRRTLPLQIVIASVSFFSVQSAIAEDFNFPGLTGTVHVFEDQYGIPTIKGEAQLDVAFVQGYIHARDRFWQMDQTRKFVAGRAAELLGPDAISSDILNRTLGLGRAALKTWQALDASTKGLLQSYANGVNTYLASNPLPPEYTALEITETDPWTTLDTLLIGKGLGASFSLGLQDLDSTIALKTYVGVGQVVGFDGEALFFEDTHRSAPPDDRVTDPGFLTGMSGAGHRTEAAGAAGKSSQAIEHRGSRTISDETLEMAVKFKEQVDSAPLFKDRLQNKEAPNGSNAWLVAGENTESGYPMIANDPHLTMDTPAQWYENHLVYERNGEEWHVNGVGLAGAPGVVLGCSSIACWGMTVNPLDVTDIFSEQLLTNALGAPTHTIYKGIPEPVTEVYNSWYVNVVGDGVPNNLVRANIGISEGAITWVVPRRNDGPLLQPSGNSALSMMYTGFRDTHEFTSFIGMNNADNMDEFVAALQYFDIAIQNVYYADIMGNIAWFTTSEKPLREDLANFTVEGLPPRFIRDGTGAAANEWLPVMNPQPNQALDYEILPFDEMPHIMPTMTRSG